MKELRRTHFPRAALQGPSGTGSRFVSWRHAAIRPAVRAGFDCVGRFSRPASRLCGLGAALLSRRRKHRRCRDNTSGAVVARAQAASPQDLQTALHFFKEQDTYLRRLLQEDEVASSEYASMRPLTDSGQSEQEVAERLHGQIHDHKEHLDAIKTERSILAFSFSSVEHGEGVLTLCTLRLPKGVICGLGLCADSDRTSATNREDLTERSEQLAALQALQRIHPGLRPEQEFSYVSEDKQVAEAQDVLTHLGSFMDSCRMDVCQPFGGSWISNVNAKFLRRFAITASTALKQSREETVTSVGASLVKQVRKCLNIDEDSLFFPHEWAVKLGDGVNRNMDVRTLGLDTLGLADAGATLQDLFGTDRDQAVREAALEEAIGRQNKRIDSLQEVMSASSNFHADDKVRSRRLWEATGQRDETWRRLEAKGLPIEEIRANISEALETNQVVVVKGGTGSGKSTQLPQFLLDDFRDWGVEYPDGEPALQVQVDRTVEVEFAGSWYPCEVLDVSEDQLAITAKYKQGGDVENDVDVETRVRAGRPHWSTRKPAIIVTQPRRIAATSLAQRVAWERFADQCGEEVGYITRGDSVRPESDNGTITYCTVGSLLKMLLSDPALSQYNVVMLDEVHERGLFTDYCLPLMRDVIRRRPDLRLVLMSATLDVESITRYFSGAPLVEVRTATRYPVEEIYLDDDFFKEFPQAGLILKEEAKSRITDSKNLQDYSSNLEAAALAEQVSNLVKEDETAKSAWIVFCSRAASGTDPWGYGVAALRSFIASMGEEHDGEQAVASRAVLAEQIRHVINYSDDAREALVEFGVGKNETLELWDTKDLIHFLESRAVRPWKLDRTSWQVNFSLPYPVDIADDLRQLCGQMVLKLCPEMLNHGQEKEMGKGSIVVFLPGLFEIDDVAEFLEKSDRASDLYILKLHSLLDKDDQQKVFEPPPPGLLKVVLTTNIAESSVTINDVECIIDTGIHKERIYHAESRSSTLDTVWTCQSNAVQRMGRAGRVRPGRVFRLYTRELLDSLPYAQSPEIQRVNMSTVCLSCVAMGRDPRDFLLTVPDPPLIDGVEAAMSELDALGAIKDGWPPSMTPLGHILTRLPLDPLQGRAMVLGVLFGIPQMTALLLVGSTETNPFGFTAREHLEETTRVQKAFCNWSDHLGILRAVREFENVYRRKGPAEARIWAQRSYMSYQRLLTISRSAYRLLVDVERCGILTSSESAEHNPEDWGLEDQEWENSSSAQGFKESTGAMFDQEEGDVRMHAEEWMEQLQRCKWDDQDDMLLVSILAAAFPTNVAIREMPDGCTHETMRTTQARFSFLSVNCNERCQADWAELPSPSWWTYSEARSSFGGQTLHSTTLLSPWHVALFAGLRHRDCPNLLLDKWISIDDASPQAALVRPLRREMQEAVQWASIAVSFDTVAQAAVSRSKALLRCLSHAIMCKELDQADVDFVRNWECPTLEENEAVLSASEDQRQELEDMLMKKSVTEIQVLLRELNAKDLTGRKADLVMRCADYLIYGEERGLGEEVDALLAGYS